MRHLRLMMIVFVLGIFALVSCNNEETLIPDNKGRLNVHLTDAPFPIDLIGSTEVTIDRLEIRKKAEAGMAEGDDSFMVISSETATINLLDLTNGVTELLTTVDLDPGYYDMIRLHVVDATITLKDGTTFDLKIPSGNASGLKIMLQPAVYIEAGKIADVLLDFDVSRSFIVKGNINGKINGFNFTPVVRGIFMEHAGSIEGLVADSTGNPIENAMVEVFISDENGNIDDDDDDQEEGEDDDQEEGDDDDEMKSGRSGDDDDDCKKGPVSSFTDADGQYKIIGLPLGTYTVICSYEGFVSDTLSDVVVSAENETIVNFELITKAE